MTFPALETEFELLMLMTWFSFLLASVAFAIMALTPYVVAYGRYKDSVCWIEKMLFLDKFHIPARLAWFIQELPAFVLPLFLLINGRCNQCCNFNTNLMILFMYFSHYVHRTFIFPFMIRGGNPMPIHWNLMATAFCAYNGYLQTEYHCSFAIYQPGYMFDLVPLTGLFLFYFGMYINISSDCILRNLRKPGERGYKIPRGLAFEYVSGANFFGEILEWWGFALVAWSLPSVAFAFMTTCNLIPRARAHHKWYLQRFPDYPKSRRAVIPFIL